MKTYQFLPILGLLFSSSLAMAAQGHEVPAIDDAAAIMLANQVQERFNVRAQLLHAARGREIVAFLGNTKAGKSTLVDLLSGKNLRADATGDYRLVNPDDPTAMPIGFTGDSETLYPKSIEVVVAGTPDNPGERRLLLYDLPGFDDTDGTVRNLVNAAFIKQILTEAASVRFVFVAGQGEFTDREMPAIQMLASINRLFPGQDLIRQNSVLVVTKSTCPDPETLVEFLERGAIAANRVQLRDHLAIWSNQQPWRFSHIRHPHQPAHPGLDTERATILSLIEQIVPGHVREIDIDAIYPNRMGVQLVAMFYSVMRQTLREHLVEPEATLPALDAMIQQCTHLEFWQRFEQNVSRQDAIGLLKDFCGRNYAQALDLFRGDNTEHVNHFVQNLRVRRAEFVRRLEAACRARMEEVIRQYLEEQRARFPVQNPIQGDAVVVAEAGPTIPLLHGLSPTFHNDLYDRICSEANIRVLAANEPEREIVRRYWAYFMDHYCQQQIAGFCRRVAEENNEQMRRYIDERFIQLQQNAGQQQRELTARMSTDMVRKSDFDAFSSRCMLLGQSYRGPWSHRDGRTNIGDIYAFQKM